MMTNDIEWKMVKLGEVCDVRDGTHDSPKFTKNGYPLVTSKNLINGKIDFSDINFISEEDYTHINQRWCYERYARKNHSFLLAANYIDEKILV